MTSKKTALVVGATGLVGSHCVELLLNHTAYRKVIVLVRRPIALQHPKLKVLLVDFNELQFHSSSLAADEVFCTLGTTMRKAGSQEAFCKVDYEYPVKLAALVQHMDTQKFLIVTSLGANPSSRIFYNRVKGEVEEAIRKIPFESIHIFRPSFLLGKRQEQRTGQNLGSAMMSIVKIIMVGSLGKYRAIDAKDVAKAMVVAAQTNTEGVQIYESDTIYKMAKSEQKVDVLEKEI